MKFINLLNVFGLGFTLITCSSSLEKPKSYAEISYWHRYQHFLPDDLRFRKYNLPTEEYFESQGYQIHLDRYPKKDAKCKILLIHGGGGNGRILGTLAIGLEHLGCEWLAPDLPGFGLTKIPSDKAFVPYQDWVFVLNDLIQKEKNPNQKIILFGLSIGGMLAYHTASENGEVDGLIATTLVDPRESDVRDAISSNWFLSRIGMPLNSFFSFATNRMYFPIKWFSKMEFITNDPNFSKVFSNDPYAGGSKVSLGFLNTFLNYKPKIEPETFRVCPVLLAHPSIDPWTPTHLSKRFFDKIPATKEFVLLVGAGHFPYEEPGVSLLKESVTKFLSDLKIK
ncbi:alpha/beta hydrolase family protein [Leptospira yanagawae serovar Saopaulo str. Sao Paulo = ATCC 700523]|uniref:Alpha/beta hydrolase family protein n=1 Tax=Leptospira yanagawae serovar Saopaulo str. Sao Paulo = ATCC 700523 TaxID=1249483 RepID=A0A5E8HE27_9LEPT|nr:alpha/beta hydrolase [Leptospira yanagawae]EOQ89494.1 alpha/beta hydrolase family protein [Leptospira yanagawae serovar Saopaulo str. Sao Paulo = ATCC 700523]